MTSSKLSPRRSTARKPPICIKQKIPIMPPTDTMHARILWTDMLATPPNVLINEIVVLTRTAPESSLFNYVNPAAGPGQLASVACDAPLNTSCNFLSVTGNDEGGASHLAEKEFEPPRPPPFTQTIELYAPDYSEPGSVIAYLFP
jgi:hypothetical protein